MLANVEIYTIICAYKIAENHVSDSNIHFRETVLALKEFFSRVLRPCISSHWYDLSSNASSPLNIFYVDHTVYTKSWDRVVWWLKKDTVCVYQFSPSVFFFTTKFSGYLWRCSFSMAQCYLIQFINVKLQYKIFEQKKSHMVSAVEMILLYLEYTHFIKDNVLQHEGITAQSKCAYIHDLHMFEAFKYNREMLGNIR